MRNLTLKHLKAIQAITVHGKIINAAKVLGLTPPAVTIQLKQLEEDVGLTLFDRTQEGMRLTAAGQAVVDAAQTIEERLRLLEDQIDAIKGVRAGSLRLGVVSTAKYFAPRLMAAFMKEYPDIDMRLLVGNREDTIASLKNHDVDVALMGRPAKDVPLRASAFGDHPLVIVAPPDHPLARARDISKERISEEHFLIREPGSGTRMSLEVFFADIPEKLEDLGTEMGSNETIKQAVMAGLGVAFISAHTIEQELQLGRLVILDVEGMPITRQWFAVSRMDRSMSPAMEAFNGFLTRHGAGCLPAVDLVPQERRAGQMSRAAGG